MLDLQGLLELSVLFLQEKIKYYKEIERKSLIKRHKSLSLRLSLHGKKLKWKLNKLSWKKMRFVKNL